MIRIVIFLAGMYWAKKENRKKTAEVGKVALVKGAELVKVGVQKIIAKIKK